MAQVLCFTAINFMAVGRARASHPELPPRRENAGAALGRVDVARGVPKDTRPSSPLLSWQLVSYTPENHHGSRTKCVGCCKKDTAKASPLLASLSF